MESAGYPVRPIVLEREFNTRYWGRPITVQAVREIILGLAQANGMLPARGTG